MARTKITSKYQTTIPEKVRKILKVKPGGEVEWHVIRGIVVVDSSKKIRNPVRFLTSQIKLELDAVKLVREAREDFA
jgi:bifunctional DNA-binding transcriptional regulator/antitoxin component of YhaV-PrlF toxin-antitoxin module